jgi:hypothetical protein
VKLIIAGSRDIDEDEAIDEIVRIAHTTNSPIAGITEIVSGTARGPDRAGESYGKYHNIPIKRFPADWNQFGKRAGHIRNREMAVYADKLFLIWDGKSKGSMNMRAVMLALGKPVIEVILPRVMKTTYRPG